ncbi:DNL-type domain-containing protein [Citrus sinensis]|uniref:DNL-type domain-containing protein n=1 Tax=Citrus sinensis TaxID=2711 RepID=A0ACB8LF63_CITSI|nr:DNL-type domain-containing protein [Citrus sinensis]
MAAITACNSSPSVSSLSTHKPLDVILRPNSFKPISFSNSATPNLIRPRLRVSGAKAVVPKRAYRILAVSESNSEAELSDSNKDATIDIKLPRRSLLVQFTCDGCGERTQRLINRLAYERGLVYVQCAGCLRHHKLVDNLGLVVEYDLREEISMESNTDQV